MPRWLRGFCCGLVSDYMNDYGIADPTHEFLQMLQQTPRHDVDRVLAR